MAKIIALSGKRGTGKYVTVDDEDYEKVMSAGMWYFQDGYAARLINKKIKKLHTFLMCTPPGMVVDHIDGNGLNCTRKNMRVCTQVQNTRNSRAYKNCFSAYKGVSRDRDKWRCRIWKDGKRINKNFKTEIDAAHAYDILALEVFGEFAGLNFPGDNAGRAALAQIDAERGQG